MSRETVEQEMEERFGRALPFFDRIPDEFLDAEWELMKRLQFGETLIPNRYKELIGLAVAAATRCSFGTALHSELARLHGATDAELQEALHFTKLASGWALFMNGLQIDQGRLEEDLAQAVAFADGRGVPNPTTEEDIMMSAQTERNKQIVRRYQDAYNSGDLDVLDELLAPDWVSNSFPTAVLEQTVENTKAVHGMVLGAFPDIQYTTQELIAEGDRVVQLWRAQSTHQGEIVGLAATGNRVEWGGLSMFEIADGKIVRHISFNDVIHILHQCGAEMPADWLAFVHRPA